MIPFKVRNTEHTETKFGAKSGGKDTTIHEFVKLLGFNQIMNHFLLFWLWFANHQFHKK